MVFILYRTDPINVSPMQRLPESTIPLLISAPRIDPPLPLLVTGVTGVTGLHAFSYFRARYPGQVWTTRQTSKWGLQGPGILPCDVEDRDELHRLFAKYRFRSVIHCLGNCALKACEIDPRLAWRMNLSSLSVLLEAIRDQPVRLICASIDLVFSGRAQGNYIESDPMDPVTVYGQSMAAAEHLIQLAAPHATVYRISLPMGISHSGHAGAIDWIQSRFRQGKPATLYYDEIRTPTYTSCLNQLFHWSLLHELPGCFHAGGPRALSLYQIAQIVNRVGGYHPDLLHGCYRRQAGPLPPRAGNVTLDSSRLGKISSSPPLAPWPVDDQLVPTHRKWHYERNEDSPGSLDWLREVLYLNPQAVSSRSFDEAAFLMCHAHDSPLH
jgi:dTDP-4-dehydrorhamnose reductase